MTWDAHTAPPRDPITAWRVLKYFLGALWLFAGLAVLVSLPIALVIALFLGVRVLLIWVGVL